MEYVPRFFAQPSQSFFLFGPRGTGKSLWTQRVFPDALRIDLLLPDLQRQLMARPEQLRELLAGNPRAQTVVIDEVQRIPDLLSVVHSELESSRPRRFVLTGSSARKLRRVGVDLLAGRALHCSLHPYMAAELGSRFDLDQALASGLVPLVVESADPRAVLASYASLYLREEVQMEGLVRNVGAFARFLEAVSFSHASMLNVSNVARECQVERKSVDAYVQILEDLLLAWRVPVFLRRAQREMTMHAKFFLFDCGVYRSVRPTGPLDRPEEIAGPALEGLVAQHLRAWIAYRGKDNQLYHWRTRGGSEVDLICYGEDGLFAIEIKNSATLNAADFRGLRAFAQDYPECTRVLLYRGSQRLSRDGVLCWPVSEFLLTLHPSSDFPIL
jgi:predicted AAA+ superfamily ATPase